MFNVILYYQDGRAFIGAEGVTLQRAKEIKAHITANQDELSYCDVTHVEIKPTTGGEYESIH